MTEELPPTKSPYMRLPQACAYLGGIHANTMRRYIISKRIRPYRVGKLYLFDEAMLKRFAEGRK